MQKFPAPDHRLKLSQETMDSLLKKENFFNIFPIYAIHVIVPGSERITEGIKKKLISPENVYFTIKDINTSSLIEASFLQNIVRKDSLWVISHKRKVNVGNFICIVPPGKLIMCLERGIAETLSLPKINPQNQKIRKKKLKGSHQTCMIDMKAQEFLPGNKLYNSTLCELNKLNDTKFDILLNWKTPDNVCTESIRSYFEEKGYECITCEPNYTSYSKNEIPCPKLDCNDFDVSTAEYVLEWMGTQICGINYKDDGDDFVSNFCMPQPFEHIQKLQISKFEGFYTGFQMHNLLPEIRKLFETNSNLPFVAVSITGYQDCYITQKGCERFSSADKMISLVFFPNLVCWVVTLNVS